LLWLGFGALDHTTWISPCDLRAEVEQTVTALGVCPYVDFFTAERRGFAGGEGIVARCWDLKRLHDYHTDLITRYGPLFQEHQTRLMASDSLEPQECFMQRIMLIHEYRSAPYVDPNLPSELLPDNWLGEQAAQLFQQYHDLLVEKAEAFVDSIFAKVPRISSQ
jgi:phenylacetic acid degradation operon negative regulatory protein